MITFDNKKCIAFCVHLDRNDLIQEIQNLRRLKRKNIQMTKILRTYYLLLEELRVPLILFLNKHNCVLSNVVFQCDSDCRNIIKDMGLNYSDPKYAHMLSDIVVV